jgi:uncharacterized protein YegL
LKTYTDITVLLDRSGSMSTIKDSMERAFNTFVAEHKANPSTRMTLVKFDSLNPYELAYLNVPIGSVEPLRLDPRGGTPLLDAMATTIDKLGDRYSSMSESERPDQVLFIIITDGQENASTQFSRRQVFDKVTNQTKNYRWQFTYLGANQDAIAEAATLGIARDWAITYSPTTAGSGSSINSLTANTMAFANSTGLDRLRGMKGYTVAQRTEATTSDSQGTLPLTPTTTKDNS